MNLSLKGRQIDLHRITEQVADDEDYRHDSYNNNNAEEGAPEEETKARHQV